MAIADAVLLGKRSGGFEGIFSRGPRVAKVPAGY
jgi:hypothetical protein